MSSLKKKGIQLFYLSSSCYDQATSTSHSESHLLLNTKVSIHALQKCVRACAPIVDVSLGDAVQSGV